MVIFINNHCHFLITFFFILKNTNTITKFREPLLFIVLKSKTIVLVKGEKNTKTTRNSRNNQTRQIKRVLSLVRDSNMSN